MAFDGASLIPIVSDIINDFGTAGKIEKWDNGNVDPITGQPLQTPDIVDIVYVLESNPANTAIGGKLQNGDALVTVQTDFIVKESYRFIDIDGNSWAIISATSTRLQGISLLWEIQVRK